jgi:hypothetical protein
MPPTGQTRRVWRDRERVVVAAAPTRVLVDPIGLDGSDHPFVRVLVQVGVIGRTVTSEVDRVDPTPWIGGVPNPEWGW